MVLDREWFEARPDARHRCRWITAAERAELGDMAGRKLSPKAVIFVEQIEPGVRKRALYTPGTDVVDAGMVGLFGHRSTFELLGAADGPLPKTHCGMLPDGLEARLFALPANLDPATFRPDIDGLVVLRPGDAFPVPFG